MSSHDTGAEAEETRRNELLRIMNIAESLLGNGSATASAATSSTTRPTAEGQRVASTARPGPSRAATNSQHSTPNPLSSSAIVNDFRRLFQPYNTNSQTSSNFMLRNQQATNTRSSVVSRRGKGRKGWKFQGRHSVKESWTHDFFCLSRRDTMYPPNTRQKLELADAGLGRRKVMFGSDDDAV